MRCSCRWVPFLKQSLVAAGAAVADQRRPSATAYCPRRDDTPTAPLVVGDASRGKRTASASICTVKDVMGIESGLPNFSARLPAGDVLALIDICAARAASKHAFGKFTMGFEAAKASSEPRYSVATVSMDNVLFKTPMMFGDQIALEGTVVDVGSSSIAVSVNVNRVQFGSKARQFVAEAMVFMVAVGESLKSAKIVPALELTTVGQQRRHTQVTRARANMKRYKDLTGKLHGEATTVADLKALVPNLFERDASKPFDIPMEETRHVANRLFFPSHLNLNNTVFGGEILRWMEAHAVHCGRVFCNNHNVVTIGMHAIEFHQPVYKTDWMTLEATVVYVKRSTMEIDVRVIADRDGESITTNRANFVLASLDVVGQPLALPAGLAVTEQDPLKVIRRRALAAIRYGWMQELKNAEVAKPPAL